MRLDHAGAALKATDLAFDEPKGSELLIEVSACGVCRTDLHEVDGDLAAKVPIIPGHEVVGRVAALGPDALGFGLGDRVGVPWLAGTCGTCMQCLAGRENLCEAAIFTGFSRDGGFASHCLADARYCLHIPERYDDCSAAPLLCAGLIGYRAYRATERAMKIGIYGFGAAGHIVAQVALSEKKSVFAFVRPGDEAGKRFALSLGCSWAGGSDEAAPEILDAAIIFAPIGPLVPTALRQIVKGGIVVCAGIHMSDIPAFPYADLWGERSIRSIANLTRADGSAFMALADRIPLKVSVNPVPLDQANHALSGLRAGAVEGAYVLVP
ncbi:zinc-dependent alcohol dehydrogenase family protein [Sphingomonas sp. ID1715]|nr:zinc-dependent alcohol dehydrogenase family protein [Sphingomonas sp. ID1715]